jgi:uncharacterized membrane protein
VVAVEIVLSAMVANGPWISRTLHYRVCFLGLFLCILTSIRNVLVKLQNVLMSSAILCLGCYYWSIDGLRVLVDTPLVSVPIVSVSTRSKKDVLSSWLYA